MSRTPAVIAERLGHEHAARLSEIAGGTRLHVPRDLDNATRLKALLGDELAVLVVLHFGDSRLYVPVATRSGPVDVRKIKKLAARGWSSARIARELRCSENTVDKKRAKLRTRSPLNHTATTHEENNR